MDTMSKVDLVPKNNPRDNDRFGLALLELIALLILVFAILILRHSWAALPVGLLLGGVIYLSVRHSKKNRCSNDNNHK